MMKWFSESLPPDWQTKALKRVSLMRYGDSMAVEDREDGDTPVYGSNGVVGTHSHANQKAPGLVVGRKGSFGKVIYCDQPCFVIDTAYGIDASCTRHDMRWLYYAVSSSTIDRKMRDSPVPGLASRDAYRINLPVPTATEQKRIAAYLDASCAAIDRAVAAKQQQLETLDALRKSIIQNAVTQGLNPEVEMKESGVPWFGRIPRHWLCESLKRSTKRIQTGTTPPTSSPEYFENGTIDWFAPESFGRTIKLGEPKKLIHESAVEDNKLRVFPPDTVLFVGIGATIGKVALLDGEGSANQQIVGITCDHRMMGRFLAYQLKNYEVIIPRIAQFTTLPILNQTKVGSLKVLRPPITEQQAICDHLESKEVELAAVEQVLRTQIETLTAYRKSLIHECVTGQRRITDADVAAVSARIDTKGEF